MIRTLFTTFFTFLLVFSINISRVDEFQDLVLDEKYENLITKGELQPELYRVFLDRENPPPAVRIVVTSEKASVQNPFTVTVVHGNTIHNMALPRIQSRDGQRFLYWFASDTLCDYDSSIEELGQPVQLSISSSLPSIFELRVKSVNDFHIKQTPVLTKASPSEPRYYMYTFPDDVDKVDVKITSNSELCATVVARRVNCPLFDASGMLELSEVYYYQTFTKFGGFSLRKSDIGSQFHVAFTVNGDDSVCGTQSNTSDHGGGPARIKAAMISVTPVAETSILSAIPLFVFILIISVVFLMTYLKYKLLDRYENNEPSIFEGTDSEGSAIVDKIWLFDAPMSVVSHKEYQKQRVVRDSKYFNFLFFQFFGSILPALTTLFQNQQQTSSKMNLDTCYLNYLCYSDLFYINSLNGMASASSLAVVGVINLIIVFRKQIFNYEVPQMPTTHGIQQRDAPKVVCLLGLIAMGFLWTITNNCPHKTTLHLYVYTSLWLFYSACMWIYSKRHGVRKWQQFFIIAVSSAYGCITLAENTFVMDEIAKILINILFFVTAVSSTGYFCYNYYFEKPSGLQRHQWIRSPLNKNEQVLGDDRVFQPLKSKMVYMAASMIYSIGCSLALFVLPTLNVYTMCFILGKGQVAIYLIFYIIQKVRFERSSFSISFKIIGPLLTVTFFTTETINRYLANYLNTFNVLTTPAISRESNMECILPGIDWNDLRQYSCALDCFLFILLIDYIDSNLKGVPKRHIFVF